MIFSPNKKPNKRGRAQSAMLEAGLASMIMAFASITFIHGVEAYEDATRVSVDSQETTSLSEMLTAYIRENERAFIATANKTTSPCGAVGTTANGGYVFQVTGSLPHNPTVAGGPYACYNLASFNLLPQGFTGTNRWHQTYYIAISNRTDTATGGISALLFTSGGGRISEPVINAYLQGLRGNGIIYGRGPSGDAKLSSGGATETTNIANLDQNLITQGHIGIDLTNEITPNLDESVERDSTVGNAAPQHMNSTLYFAGLNPYNGHTNNLQLNGPVINELDPDASKNIAAATNSATAPTNGVFGARQVSTQMLTPGNSLQTQYQTNSNQAKAQHSKIITVNDDYNDPGDNNYTDNNGTTRSRFADNYLVANTNINITAGYKLSAADGLHITSTTSTIQNDFNNSPNGTQTGEIPNNGFGVYPYDHTAGIPGLTWDAAQGSGLMIYNDYGVRSYAPNDPFGATFWIATYSKNTVAPGLEATGGMRAPVYYSDREMNYYIQPDYFSRLSTVQAADINLVGDGKNDYNTNTPTSGTLRTSNNTNTPWPEGWGGTGIITFDIASNGGTIATANVVNGQTKISAYINRDGDLNANRKISSGIFQAKNRYTPDTSCANTTLIPSDNYFAEPIAAQRDKMNIPDSSLAVSTDNTYQPIYCDPMTHTWKIFSKNIFENIELLQSAAQSGSYTNSTSTVEYIMISDTANYGTDARGGQVGVQAYINGTNEVCHNSIRSSTSSVSGNSQCGFVLQPGSTMTWNNQGVSGDAMPFYNVFLYY